ncbi:hypothetical protein [Candidatus Chlorohelix sp.]|uniref:hypothetical protein n=1 Tax=Candidatus Chlorohelix sp. TaxID=3139201 RepID=UPI00305C7427
MDSVPHIFTELEMHKVALSKLENAAGAYGYLQVPQTLVMQMEQELLAIAQLERELILRGHLQMPDDIKITPLNQRPLTEPAPTPTPAPNSREVSPKFLIFVVILLILLIAFLLALLFLPH